MTAKIEPSPKVEARPVVVCLSALFLCVLVSISPLFRFAGKYFLLPLPTNQFLLLWGSWVPSNLHFTSARGSSSLEFVVLMLLAFVAYALSALFIFRQPPERTYTHIQRLILFGALIVGLIFVLTPAMLSRDIFVYAGYGRTIIAHQANPYFVPLTAFPKDPLIPLDDWSPSTSAYGPAWLAICAFWSWLIGTSPLAYVLSFRLFTLAIHLLNTLLIMAILRKMGRSSRTVTLAALFYAWNPLMLLESSLGAHNDLVMLLILLLGILFCVQAEKQHLTHSSLYLFPIICFTLATLVKFTAAPSIFFYLIFLVRHSLYPTVNQSHIPQWKPALCKGLLASSVSVLLTLVFYLPSWLGHSIPAIATSFSSPPSSVLSENSLMRGITESLQANASSSPAHPSWTYALLSFFSQRNVWNDINIAALLILLIVGGIWLWRSPTTRTLILALLTTLAVLLIITPWFFPWYVTWLIPLAALCLPPAHARFGRALTAFTVTFSATSLQIYLLGNPPIGGWNGYNWSLMVGLPILAFLFFYLFPNDTRKHSSFPDFEKISTKNP